MSLPEVIQCKLWEHVEEIVDQLKPSEPGVAALADRNGRLPLHHAADFSCPVALVEKLRYAFPAAVRCADDNDRIRTGADPGGQAGAETRTL